METRRDEVLIRLRMSQADAHYGGDLVDGARMLALFGDVATELLIRLDGRRNIVPDAALEKMRYALEKCGSEAKSVEVLKGYQKGLWDLFEKTFAVSWVAAASDAAATARIEQDVEAVLNTLQQQLRKHLAHPDNAAQWFARRGTLAGGAAARASWRVMFAETLLRWEEKIQQEGSKT